ncbi:cupin [Corynebacterium sp.]|uniref:cupin domain-containing protein n=1 Tax=Corynebacterium sp. TaxID=1720 RepID=UPI0028AAE758|nr:cupin [Corynebacterium sp.]
MTEQTQKQFPQVVGDVAEVLSAPSDASGSIWKLEPHTRGLDCNIIAIAPGEEISRHEGPDLDVVIVVLDGSGVLETEVDSIDLVNGSMVWLPKLSVRRFVAGENGLRYFSVHTRKRGLQIGRPPARD